MLAAFAGVWPTEVRAGCNHPWVQHSDPFGSLNELDLFGASHPGIDADSGGVPDRRERRSPCAGGACSRSPDLPVSRSDSIPGPMEQWGDLPAALDHLASASSDRIGASPDRPRPTPILLPIERPPRELTPA